MPEPVRCDICGKIYSSRHVSSHKRLAHPKVRPDLTAQQPPTESICHLFTGLSAEDKERVLAELAALRNQQRS